MIASKKAISCYRYHLIFFDRVLFIHLFLFFHYISVSFAQLFISYIHLTSSNESETGRGLLFLSAVILFYNVFFVFLEINLANFHLSVLFLFCNCYPSFHCIECPNARLSNFVVWFSIWSSLIVITDEGRNPETGWLRSYLIIRYKSGRTTSKTTQQNYSIRRLAFNTMRRIAVAKEKKKRFVLSYSIHLDVDLIASKKAISCDRYHLILFYLVLFIHFFVSFRYISVSFAQLFISYIHLTSSNESETGRGLLFLSAAILFYNVFFVFLEINLANFHLSVLFLFCNCYPSSHCIECPNARLNNFVVWFSMWSSLIVITDEGRNPKTGWLRSYLVYIIYIYY